MKRDKARKKTDKLLKNTERQLKKIYKGAYSELVRDWNKYMKSIEIDVKDSWLEYQNALKLNDEALIKKTSKAYKDIVTEKTFMSKHYQDMIDDVTTKLSHVNEIATAYVNGQMPEIYAINLNGANKIVKDYVTGFNFTLIDKDVAKNMIFGNKKYMDYFKTVDIPKDKLWNKKLIHSQMTRGILKGESIDKLSKRFMQVTDANEKSAIRHARTMTTAIENKGRMDGFERAEKKGIVMKKIWIATEDSRTRNAHLELNGQELDLDEYFVNEFGEIYEPGDVSASPANIYNCRCTLGGRVVGFKKDDGTINYID